MSLQLSYRFFKYPKGMVDNLLVQVDKLIILVDFVIMGMHENPSMDKDHIILLGRPFIAITKVIIDVHNLKLTMKILGDTVDCKKLYSFPIPPIFSYYYDIDI